HRFRRDLLGEGADPGTAAQARRLPHGYVCDDGAVPIARVLIESIRLHAPFTSPRRGEVELRSNSGEGVSYCESYKPLTRIASEDAIRPLPMGEITFRTTNSRRPDKERP